MPIYNLLEYSKNYPKTSVFLWNYYRDELTDEANDNDDPNRNVINSRIRQILQELLVMFLGEKLIKMEIMQIILIMFQIKESQNKLKFLCH